MSRGALHSRQKPIPEVGVRQVKTAPTKGVRQPGQVELFNALAAKTTIEPVELLEQAWLNGRAQGLAASLFAEDGDESSDEVALPKTIELIPSGRVVKGRDGRQFMVDRNEIIQRAHDNDADLFLDWDHAAFAWFNGGGPNGEQAPAAAWIDHKSIRRKGKSKHAAIVGDVLHWTPDGAASVEARSYRYISPAVAMHYHDDEDVMPTAVELLNGALVNMPALRMPALAGRQPEGQAPKEQTMDPKTIAMALGLKPDTSETEILAAAAASKDAASALVILQTEHDALAEKHTKVFASLEKAQTEAAEATEALKTTQAEHQRASFSMRLDALASKQGAPITPAQSKALKEEGDELCELGPKGVEIFEKRVAKLEAGGKPVLPEVEDLDQRDPPASEIKVAGLSREAVLASIEVSNKRRPKGSPEMTLESYCKANPQFAGLLKGAA